MHQFPSDPRNHNPTEMEHRYTSTGVKWWRHPAQMASYHLGRGKTAISTHIAPEGACNLKCPYCSVTHRDTHSRIDIQTIQDYVTKLKFRGLRAVILTGGGEPTAYPKFNELASWIHNEGLKLALITNGTLSHKVEDDVWGLFEWIRVSVNFFPGWEERISIPGKLLKDSCVVGCSTVFTQLHESPGEISDGWEKLYKKVCLVANNVGAEYIRVLPNCLQPQDKLIAEHRKLSELLNSLDDSRFFHQYKIHSAPDSHVCHQSFFRPYLSEEPNPWDGKPGTVFPCDSVVLNAPSPTDYGYGKFMEKYAICTPGRILDYLDQEITASFTPKVDCEGCVFTKNVEMLGEWKKHGNWVNQGPVQHEEFV